LSQIKPVNKVLVTIPKEFEDEICTESGFKLFKDPSYSKEWNASVTGRVAMLSDLVSEENKGIYDELDLGTEVAFDFKVVADFDYVSDQEHFHEITPEGSKFIRKFVNKKGFWINIRAYQTHFGRKWSGWLQDRFMNYVDGVEGLERDLERWLSQFTFGKTDSFVFKNKIFVDKKPYWVCDFQQIIARKVQDEWVAMPPYVICKPLEVDVTKRVSMTAGGIHLPDSSIKMRFYDRGVHLNGAEGMGIKKHEVIAFEEKYLYKNVIEGVEYFFIKQYHVDGTYPVN
jgi:hypothetical protein